VVYNSKNDQNLCTPRHSKSLDACLLNYRWQRSSHGGRYSGTDSWSASAVCYNHHRAWHCEPRGHHACYCYRPGNYRSNCYIQGGRKNL